MKIGLVLSGGFAKGAYQIGTLRALSQFLPLEEIKYMSCASIGAINGYAYATKNFGKAEDLWKNICSDGNSFFITKMLRSNTMKDCILSLETDKYKPQIPFYCSLLDIKNRNIVYKNLAKVESPQIKKYLKASISLPPYNRPVTIDGNSYLDGGLVDNIPVSPLMKHNLDYIICVYFDDTCYKFENAYFDNKIIKITFPSTTMISHSFMVTKSNIEEMIKTGYDVTMFKLSSIFYKGYEDLDYVYSAIEYMNKESKNDSLRLTTDVVITNLNKVTQKLTKRKIL